MASLDGCHSHIGANGLLTVRYRSRSSMDVETMNNKGADLSQSVNVALTTAVVLLTL